MLLQKEIFIKAIEAINNFNGNCDIRVWLCKIEKNNYFSYLRKNKKLVYVDKYKEQEAVFDMEV